MKIIDWEEQKKIERKISWVTAKEDYNFKTGVRCKKFSGLTFDDIFSDIETECLVGDAYFDDPEENELLVETEDGLELHATNQQLCDMLMNEYHFHVEVTDWETDISFKVEDCTVNWEEGTFVVDYFNENVKFEVEDYFEELNGEL